MSTWDVVLATWLAAAPAATGPPAGTESPCRPDAAPQACAGNGIFWCGSSDEVDVAQLARCAAPVLWFSPDEPLLLRKVRIPQAFVIPPPGAPPRHGLDDDGHAPPGEPTVYWHLRRVQTSRGRRVADDVREQVARGKLPLGKTRRLTIHYLFYYERDFGLGSHYHDLEGAQAEIVIVHPSSGQSVASAQIDRITAFGHGSDLLSNVLQVRPSIQQREGAPGLRLPWTLLVEEGKHASCPDRNGDGHYMPGYDVNVSVTDAWGVRDTLGSGLIRSHYQSWMTKPRRPEDRIGPPLAEHDGLRGQYERGQGRGAYPRAYALVEAPRPDATDCCRGREILRADCLADQPEAGRKCDFVHLRRNACCRLQPPQVTSAWLTYVDSSPLDPRRFLALGARTDGRKHGFALSFFSPIGLPGFGGWPSARFFLVRDDRRWRKRLDVSFAPALSRITDWYVAVGYDWGLRETHFEAAEAGGPVAPRVGRDGAWAGEAGLQVRHRRYGVRVGLRANVAGGGVRNARLVAEAVVGPSPRHASRIR
jgi:hypothetical protein